MPCYISIMKGLKITFLFLTLFFFNTLSAFAGSFKLHYEGLDGEMGFLWKNNEGYDTEPGDSGPDVLTFIPGISVFFSIDKHWFFRPALFVYGETLEYLPVRDYTIPVDSANINSMTVGAIFLQAPWGCRWTFKERHTIGIQGGPGFHFQFPMYGPGEPYRHDMQKALIQEFLYFNLGAWYYNPLTKRYGFSFKIETGLPVYNAWTARGLPFSEGIMVNFLVGIRVLLQKES